MRRRPLEIHAAALLLVACTSACFLFQSKTEAPAREYTPEEKELMVDYELAKESGERSLSSCVWDFTVLRKKLREGPKDRASSYQTDLQCRNALEEGTSNPDLANKYIAKFAELDEARSELIADAKTLKHEQTMAQCMEHVDGFEQKHDGINVAAFLTRCIGKFEKIPEQERAALEDVRVSLEDKTTLHAELLANFERLKVDPTFKKLLDQHLELLDEEAMLKLRIHELEQHRGSPEANNAISIARMRLRKVQEAMKDNLEQRKPFYVQYDVVIQ